MEGVLFISFIYFFGGWGGGEEQCRPRSKGTAGELGISLLLSIQQLFNVNIHLYRKQKSSNGFTLNSNKIIE